MQQSGQPAVAAAPDDAPTLVEDPDDEPALAAPEAAGVLGVAAGLPVPESLEPPEPVDPVSALDDVEPAGTLPLPLRPDRESLR